jgi:hypothetical protein
LGKRSGKHLELAFHGGWAVFLKRTEIISF